MKEEEERILSNKTADLNSNTEYFNNQTKGGRPKTSVREDDLPGGKRRNKCPGNKPES